mgnify:CR=1 FL=1
MRGKSWHFFKEISEFTSDFESFQLFECQFGSIQGFRLFTIRIECDNGRMPMSEALSSKPQPGWRPTRAKRATSHRDMRLKRASSQRKRSDSPTRQSRRRDMPPTEAIRWRQVPLSDAVSRLRHNGPEKFLQFPNPTNQSF